MAEAGFYDLQHTQNSPKTEKEKGGSQLRTVEEKGRERKREREKGRAKRGGAGDATHKQGENQMSKRESSQSPEEPKPPEPRPVASKEGRSTGAATQIFSSISWAMRSPLPTWKSKAPKLNRSTMTLPR